MTYKHILAAVDGTDESEQVLEAAAGTAKQSGAKLSLLSVVKPINQIYPGYEMSGGFGKTLNLEAEVQNELRQRLGEKAETIGVDPIDVHVEIGYPVTIIHAIASSLGADLIVIGTHGRHGLGLLLGSTANSVLHGITCDALVVRIDKGSP